MTIVSSKLGSYRVEGVEGNRVASKLGMYLVEGTDRRVISSKVGMYLVEGPPLIIPPAPRRRQLNMP